MMQEVLIIVRAMGIAWGYAVTLGCLYAARAFWIIQAPYFGTRASRFQGAAEAVLRTSPFIVLTSSMFTLTTIPLAAWSVGPASWSSLKRYIYGFWLVLALFIVASENADGLILISGAGLITLWFLRNRESLIPAGIQSKDSFARSDAFANGSRRNITVFAILTVITCVLSLELFLGNGTKVYVSEIIAIYAIACICQGLKTFHQLRVLEMRAAE
ncbi:MAG TPA: hypothetical protein VIX42_07670 [Edaphobacter sp.]